MKTTIDSTVIQTVARELAEAFTSDTRTPEAGGGKFYKIRDDSPEWTRNEMSRNRLNECLMLRLHEAVDDRFPNDWVYENSYFIAQQLAEYDTIDAMREASSEIADSLVDVYNTERTAWLASHLGNCALCDEAVSEFGVESKDFDICKIIGMGQYLGLDRICQQMIAEIENEAGDRESKS